MDFYTYCLISEVNLPQAIQSKDSVLRVFKNRTDTSTAPKTNIPELYDFGTVCPEGYEDIGDMVFRPLSEKRNEVSIHSALVFRPSKSQNSADKIELFHLARDRHKKRVDKNGEPLPEIHDERYKKDFFNATVDKTVETLLKVNTDTILYISSKSPFNITVIEAAKRIKPEIKVTNNIDNVILKHPYSELIKLIDDNPSRLKSLMQTKQDETFGTRASIIANAYLRMLQKLATGGSYTVGETIVTKDTDASIELTADCIGAEWKAAMSEVAKSKTIAPSDHASDKRRIISYLIPWEHYNFTNAKDKINQATNITVLDDNISSGKTFDEVNRKLKQIIKSPNVVINWVVGIKLPGIK